MDEIVHNVRRQQWLSIIQACNASGQSKNQWCDENGIDRRKFYHWQKKLRTELYQEAHEQSCTAFVQSPIWKETHRHWWSFRHRRCH